MLRPAGVVSGRRADHLGTDRRLVPPGADGNRTQDNDATTRRPDLLEETKRPDSLPDLTDSNPPVCVLLYPEGGAGMQIFGSKCPRGRGHAHPLDGGKGGVKLL